MEMLPIRTVTFVLGLIVLGKDILAQETTTRKQVTNYLSAPSGTVRYPDDNRIKYSNNEDVSWLIDLQAYDAPINVTFQALSIEYCGSCACDSLRLYDGPNTASREIARLCGDYYSVSAPYLTTGGIAFLRFTSDSKDTKTGFTFNYATTAAAISDTTTTPKLEETTTPKLIKNQTITLYDFNSTIKHPDSGNYGDNEFIVWRIDHRSYGQELRIRFTIRSLKIQSCSQDCLCDSLEIFDGLDPDYSRRIMVYCGTNVISHSVYSMGPTASVRFKSDSSISKSGFTLDFSGEFMEPPVIVEDWSGIITHPASDSVSYDPNELKLWRIDHRRFGAFSNIRFVVQRLDIEECSNLSTNESCLCDALEIFDGPDSQDNMRIMQACGSRQPSEEAYYSSGPVALVRFKSDHAVQKSGFSVRFDGENAATTVVMPTTATTKTTTTETITTTTATTVKIITTTTEEPNKLPWPRADELLGFWPLDKSARLSDITGKTLPCKQCHGILQTSSAGPFGQTGTSYTTNGQTGKDILDVEDVRPVSNSAITISMFVRAPTMLSSSDFGLLSFSDSAGVGHLQIDIVYASFSSTYRPMLRIRNANSTSVTTFDIFQPNGWTFFAVVIENSKWSPCTVSVYGRHGLVYKPIVHQGLCDDLHLNNNIRLGFANSVAYLPTDISVSCLMMYSTVLTDTEIREAYHSCRAAQGTPPCGSPMLAYPSIPSDATTEPRYGQFPWIASIRTTRNPNAVACSAGIYDSFYLITSASCFLGSNVASDYTVRVGDFDLAHTETYERTHNIRNIKIYPFYDNNTSIGDIALIELSTAIDFTNLYVSPMCFPEFALSQTGDVPSDETLYFYGWGQYGRSSLISQSSPRYFLGSQMSGSNCSTSYPDAYKQPLSTCFQVQIEAGTGRKVPCNGDEGGPLMYASTDMLGNDNLKTIAIYTKHTGCSPSYPALFTLIAPYMQWITQATACTLPGYFYPAACPMYSQ